MRLFCYLTSFSFLQIIRSYPELSDGIANRTACISTYTSQCADFYIIQVKNCKSFFVFYLVTTNGCPERYCFGEGPCPTTPATTITTTKVIPNITTYATTTLNPFATTTAATTTPSASSTVPATRTVLATTSATETTSTSYTFIINADSVTVGLILAVVGLCLISTVSVVATIVYFKRRQVPPKSDLKGQLFVVSAEKELSGSIHHHNNTFA